MAILEQKVERALTATQAGGRGSLRREAAAWGGLLGGCVAAIVCAAYLFVSALLGTAQGLWLHVLLAWLLLSAVLGVWIGAALAGQVGQQPADDAAQDDPAPTANDTGAPANWRRDPSGDLMYPIETLPGARSFGR